MRAHDTSEDYGIGRGSLAERGTLFGRTMGLVALTTGFFTLGAFLGRHLSYGWGWVFFALSFAFLLGMRFSVKAASSSASVGLLVAFGITMGLATGPTVAYYEGADPARAWEAAGATALFMGGLGAAGYATRRDLSALGRVALWALVALLIFGVVSIFVSIPGSSLTYSILGLVVFAALVLVDFQRLRTVRDIDAAPLMAASIFLDALNVFLFLLNLFRRRD